ncbi:MAG: hydrogenase maturation protease [Actinomycetota bacterium]|nr:hydrogenase maturation protease [Actinomycetota bacterium]
MIARLSTPIPPAPRSPPTAPDVVIGLGNEIAGDDGAGIEVARILEKQLADDAAIDVIALAWAGFALLDVLRGRKRAAIVDCLTTGVHVPGAIVRIGETDIAGSVRLNSFHDISYPTVMALGRRLGWEMPEIIAIWGIEASSVGVFSETLSPPVARSTHEVANQVIEFLRNRDGPRQPARE